MAFGAVVPARMAHHACLPEPLVHPVVHVPVHPQRRLVPRNHRIEVGGEPGIQSTALEPGPNAPRAWAAWWVMTTGVSPHDPALSSSASMNARCSTSRRADSLVVKLPAAPPRSCNRSLSSEGLCPRDDRAIGKRSQGADPPESGPGRRRRRGEGRGCPGTAPGFEKGWPSLRVSRSVVPPGAGAGSGARATT